MKEEKKNSSKYQIFFLRFHQWYDIARYLNQNKQTDNYYSIKNYLTNLESTTNLTKCLMEYHLKD